YLPGETRRHQRGWLVVENIKNGRAVRARLLSDRIDAAKSFGYQERGTGAFFFQQRIGPHRCPVTEIADLARSIRTQRLNPRQDRARGIIRGRWKLGDGELTARFIEINKVRKRASGIDRDAVGSHAFFAIPAVRSESRRDYAPELLRPLIKQIEQQEPKAAPAVSPGVQ